MAILVEQLQKLINPIEYGWRDIPTEIYHADKSAVNFSSLKHMDKSEFAFSQSYWGEQKEPTKAMKFGTLAHMAILEGSKFKERYVVMPEFTGLTAKGEITTSKNATDVKLKIAKWISEQSKDAVIVTEEERVKLFNMIDSVLSNEMAVELLKNGKPETIGYWQDPVTKINLRMMADFLTFNVDILVDVKTCQDVRWEFFRNSVENYRYDLQMAMYAEGVKHITGITPKHRAWLVIESEAPHEVRIHHAGDIYGEIGAFEFRRAVDKLKLAIDKNHFPQGGKDIMISEPSSWFKKKYVDLGIIKDQI